MKRLVFIIIFASFPVLLISQDNIPRKANLITVSNTLLKAQNYDSVVKNLFEAGFGIFNSDKESGIIITTEKPFKNGVVRINILVRDEEISLRGDFRDNMSLDIGGVIEGPSWSPIEFTGMKNSIYRNAWNEMYGLALIMEGTKHYAVK